LPEGKRAVAKKSVEVPDVKKQSVARTSTIGLDLAAVHGCADPRPRLEAAVRGGLLGG
jgi:hypothetical protein